MPIAAKGVQIKTKVPLANTTKVKVSPALVPPLREELRANDRSLVCYAKLNFNLRAKRSIEL